jgi:hypothetical protein
MAKIVLRGREYEKKMLTGAYSRYADLYRNSIIAALRQIGVKEDNVKIDIEPAAFRKAPASVSWYLDGRHLHYSCNKCGKYVENLYLVLSVIKYNVDAVVSGELPIAEFFEEFMEEEDIHASRKEARLELGLAEDTDDFELITKTYKTLAKQHHPDMANGDENKFKAINKAHKTLKRELT